MRPGLHWMRGAVERRLGRTGWDLSVVFLGNLLSKSLGLLTFILVTRQLTPGEYGLFMLAQAVFQISLRMSELGLDTAITRFLSKAIRAADRPQGETVLKVTFIAKVSTAFGMLALAQATAPWVAGELLARPETTTFLRIAYIGLVGMQLDGFYRAYFGARLEFGRGALFGALTPAMILAAVVMIWTRGGLDVRRCLEVYAFAPLLVAVLALAMVPHGFLRRRGAGRAVLTDLLSFSRWIYVSKMLGSLRFRLNTLLLSRFATIEAVGLYNYGDKLASLVSIFTSTLLTVLIPRVSHLSSLGEHRRFLSRTLRWSLGLLPTLIVVPFGARYAIGVLAPDYLEAAPIFGILFVSVVFSLLALPARAVMYSRNRAQVETLIEAAALVLALLLGLLLIPGHGGRGAAIAMLVQRFLSLVMTFGWVHREMHRRNRTDLG